MAFDRSQTRINRWSHRSWVSVVVGGAEPHGREVGVDLGGAERLVAEQFLNGAEVRAVVEQVCCEGVAEGVWADLWIEARFLEVLVELASNGSGAESAAVLVDEQRDSGVGHRLFTQFGEA